MQPVSIDPIALVKKQQLAVYFLAIPRSVAWGRLELQDAVVKKCRLVLVSQLAGFVHKYHA